MIQVKQGSGIRSFAFPLTKVEMMNNIDAACKREGTKFSNLIMDLLEAYHMQHAKSQNPQTCIDLFDDGLVNAVPNLYRDDDAWKKFYNLLNDEEYKKVDSQLNMILNLHNKRIKQ